MEEKHLGAAPPLVLEAPHHPISRAKIDPDALKVIDRLDRQGFMACLVGGAVRDLMLGKAPKDFDVATDARPGQIKKRFANAYIIGRRFRLVHVRFPNGKVVEVATFRRAVTKEEEDLQASLEAQGLEPPPIDPYGTPREDVFRRDLTINALIYDAVLDAVVDYVGGLDDLKHKRIRVIGDPAERFVEDPVRVWRVVRHAARLGFAIDESVERALPAHVALLAECAGARLYEELNKDLNAPASAAILSALRQRRILGHVLGRVGLDYEGDDHLFGRVRRLLEAADKAKAAGDPLALEELYALFFWPWAEPRLADPRPDAHRALADAYMEAPGRAVIPKKLRSDLVQIQTIAAQLVRAARTGRMRWSLAKRAHYGPAVRLFFLLKEGRMPGEGESPEKLLPAVGQDRPGRRRHGRRKKRTGASS